MMSDQTIVKVENFVILSGKPFIIGRKFVDLCNFYPAPFDSTMLNIYQCKMSHDLDCWPIVECMFQMYLMPITATDTFAVFPIENL